MDTEAGVENEFYMDEFEMDHEDNLESKIICNKLLLPGFCSAEPYVPILLGLHSAKHHHLEDNASMIKFDMICFSLPADPISATVNQIFLISVAN